MRTLVFMDGPLEGQTRRMRTPFSAQVDIPESVDNRFIVHRYRIDYDNDNDNGPWTCHHLTTFGG